MGVAFLVRLWLCGFDRHGYGGHCRDTGSIRDLRFFYRPIGSGLCGNCPVLCWLWVAAGLAGLSLLVWLACWLGWLGWTALAGRLFMGIEDPLVILTVLYRQDMSIHLIGLVWPGRQLSHISGGNCAFCYSFMTTQSHHLLGCVWGFAGGPTLQPKSIRGRVDCTALPFFGTNDYVPHILYIIFIFIRKFRNQLRNRVFFYFLCPTYPPLRQNLLKYVHRGCCYYYCEI